MKAVFDSNVLIAAYLTEGLCSRLLRRARHRQFELITCPLIIEECRQNLQELTSPLPQTLKITILQLQALATMVSPDSTLIPSVCRDPADNAVLGCALTAQADYLVTGDRDLLDLHPYRNLPFVPPRDFESLFVD